MDDLNDAAGGDDGDGDQHLLDDLLATIKKYVVLDENAAVATALWIAVTHVLPAFECAPRLGITSPTKRCGKTRLLDIAGATCHKALPTSDASVAAIFRSLGGEHPPTLIIDEADAMFGTKKLAEQNEDLRKLLNAGHQRGRPALRCVGPQQIPTEFPVFAMAALGGIGNLPDTITDRAVNITMRRRTSGEKVSQFRSRRDGPILRVLRDRLAAWGAEHIEELSKAEPDMPVEDRVADTWEPLIAVADCVGGRWPRLARKVCKAMESAADEADEEASLNLMLLSDLRSIFERKSVPFLSSADLVKELRWIEESPWSDFELNASKLAYRLKPFGVKPGHNHEKTQRGYTLESLFDAFRRYLRPDPSNPSETHAEQANSRDGQNSPDGPGCPLDGSGRPDENSRPTETADQTAYGTTWTGPDAGTAKNGHAKARCDCGQELTAPESIERGYCQECGLSRTANVKQDNNTQQEGSTA